MNDNSIIIIGAGFAGLAAGIYAQMNGYRTRIFEMHSLPGGLCTAWKRQGYTIDGCIHWLVGSSPKSSYHRLWQEVGIAQGREFINLDEFARYEGADGRTFILHADVDKLEQHMLALAPADAAATREFIRGIRLCLAFDPPDEFDPPRTRLRKTLKLGLLMARRGREMQQWMQTTIGAFADRFGDPLIREALREAWYPEFSILFMLFTFAWLHAGNAGYPIGGSLPMSRALEKRYLDLGGEIHYHSRVEQVLVEDDRAVGVRLADGSEHRAGRVVSAADGHSTIFAMLGGRYADDEARRPYAEWPTFPALLFIGLGVNRSFAAEPKTVSGLSFALAQPTEIADAVYERLPVRICNQDPTLAPAGKTCLAVMLSSSYDYWRVLAADRAAYDEKKDQVARTVVALLDQRFPGLSDHVEMVDVATPLTWERYTGNWKGSFEGWLLTPQNAFTMIRPMRQTLPGLQNFYLCGQWVEPGGGLPTAVMSGRRLVKALCKEDGVAFSAALPAAAR